MSLPQWKGLWDWSLKHADGTGNSRFKPEDVDPEKMKWLDEALKSYMVDFGARMRDIKSKLASDTPSASAAGNKDKDQSGAAAAAADADGAEGEEDTDVEEKEQLLEELMDIVGSIDYARDLHKIGGVPVLLELLESPAPGLRWRAAEVVATCVANNPPVQEWFLEGGVLPKLLALAQPAQPPTCRTKALLAISGLVRHFAPGLAALRAAGGLPLVVECCKAADRRVARKAMTTLTYMLSQRQADCDGAVAADGVLPPLVAALAAGSGGAAGGGGEEEAEEPGSQEDSDFRQAALGVLLQLARYPGTWAAVRDAPGLRARLTALEAAHLALPAETREAQAEELAAVRKLAALLVAPAAPALQPDASDHVSVAAFEASGGAEEMTISVNQPPATAKGGDGGAGAADQGPVAGGGAAASGAHGGEAEARAAASAAPLLLGPP
ncbi:hypothetical protein HYH02_012296 [Chlamydomonas schloesseri]|uniref:Nucleotide exchange factor Fes1 domain-containing protein n=1 Tax=Chlamydomonas schloesseri TaxID=2026947 RepID=A0A835SW86_9CHLO|nr:hypothetical protein HYH02_012296 [Chlamydomonas schloesseri]|eukprot:KAG2434467.1 hypothetical protein HYH02_012296 [Chlamydomonas schloesseri]